MAKDPAFLFYPGDFNTGTQFITDEQVGKYMRLLMAQHQHGHLTDKHVIHICKSYDNDVMTKFKKDKDGNWYNERLESEIVRRKEYSKSRGENRGGKKNISKSYVPHMETKNETIATIKNNNKSISKNDLFESIFTDEIYIEQISMTHKGKDIKQAWEECYTHHSQTPSAPREVWEWKQKLNTWLSIKSKERTNGKPKLDMLTELQEIQRHGNQ